ncbi:3-oxoacyl-[acyl-carrier-protein] synthase III C-terminal domain-containing protein [Actinosynnema sp. CA-299493]
MSGVTTLERVESHLPDGDTRIEELAGRLRLRRAEVGVFRKIYGLDRLRHEPGGDLYDLVLPAARRALTAVPAGKHVSYVVYAHTTQIVTAADTEAAQVIRDRLDLPGATAFAVNQQACVSSLGAVDLVAELLRVDGDPDARALVVTGERAFSPTVQLIPRTAIMAEAAASCLVAVDGEGDPVLSYVTRTLGQFADGLLLDAEGIHQFGLVYSRTLAEVMLLAVEEAGLTFGDIALVLPHNVNVVSWKQTIREMGADVDRFYLDNIPRYSHCYSADVFLNYTTARAEGRLVEGAHYLLVSVGLGATFGAMVITRRGER